MAMPRKKKKGARKPRKKKCKACGKIFQPERHFQKGCGIPCVIKIVNDDKEKKYRCINDSDILMVIGEENET